MVFRTGGVLSHLGLASADATTLRAGDNEGGQSGVTRLERRSHGSFCLSLLIIVAAGSTGSAGIITRVYLSKCVQMVSKVGFVVSPVKYKGQVLDIVEPGTYVVRVR